MAAAEVFSREGVQHVLELGFGQGRDTVLFAQRGMRVTGFDYAPRAVEEVREACRDRGLGERVSVAEWDLRRPLPLPDASVDACYSHMLLCMEFSEWEIAAILREIHRVLRPGGVALYTVRSTYDKHYRAGVPRGGDLYDVGGFVVHFFSEAKIRRLARGFEALGVERVQEGSLPRDLFQVTMRKIDCFSFARAASTNEQELEETAAIAMSVGAYKSKLLFDRMCQAGEDAGGAVCELPAPGSPPGKT
jgi:SAM-dependent methyltransferase